MTQVPETDAIDNDYDAFPYESYPFPKTTPDQLYTLGKLFGLKSATATKCRMLDVGCASGGNIIPLAELYPESEFVGIDLSKRQIDDGNSIIEALGLTNVTLKHVSLTDIDESFGQFDYVVAHGVYSWVAPDVQESLLDMIRKVMAPTGMAYVSYNTLPGWNMVRSIRDMMNFHTRSISSPVEKVGQARAMLKFISENVKKDDSPYGKFLEQELERVNRGNDSYIYHDHLERENNPCYLYEFMDSARAKGLDYVGDSDLASMFLENFSESVAELLHGLNDLMYAEQYMDFLNDRRFRCSVLCHKEQKIDRNVSADLIHEFSFSSSLQMQGPQEDVFKQDVEVTFSCAAGEIKVKNIGGKLALYYLDKLRARPVTLEELAEAMQVHFVDADNAAVQQLIISQLNPMRMVFSGVLRLASNPASYTREISDKPSTTRLVRYQVQSSNQVTTCQHDSITVDDVSKILLSYLDGTRDNEALADAMIKHVETGELKVTDKSGDPITDQTDIRKSLLETIENGLPILAAQALIVE